MSDFIHTTYTDNLILDSRFHKIRPSNVESNKNIDNTNQKPTSSQKWWISGLVGMLFFVLSSKIMYSITGSVFSKFNGPSINIGDGPPLFGLIIHSILFVLVIRLILS